MNGKLFKIFFHTISSFNPEKGTQMETHYLRISKISLFVILERSGKTPKKSKYLESRKVDQWSCLISI